MDVRLPTYALALVLLVAPAARAQTPGTIARESATSLGEGGLGNSAAPALSADGRFVAFQSDAGNLVPNDTNGDTDVFVRDRQTGVVQRVSIAWNGMEARDDSTCPALSADGRFVAFLSRAWNLYPGGANLGHPRWDVHVHDRQDGTTTRLSVADGGGDPDGDSGCPVISADGTLVAFHSDAANLVAGDDNELTDVFVADRATGGVRRVSTRPNGTSPDGASLNPAISGDGRFVAFESRASNLRRRGPTRRIPLLGFTSNVFVVELATNDVEAVSVAVEDAYPYSPQGDSTEPAISFDGRYVAFKSTAWNLVKPESIHRRHLYVRDREGGTTVRVSERDPSVVECGRDGVSFVCSATDHGRPAISGDGRFVAFSSRSLNLLPANVYHGDQIYLVDRAGGRLRRVSVESSGWAGDGCSVEPALSFDGKVLAYRTSSRNLAAPDDDDGATDVVSQEWTCDASGRCRVLAACPSQPAACTPATGSLLRLRKRPAGGLHPDRLFWRWSGPPSSEFPSPISDDSRYQLCVYAGEGPELALDVALPTGSECAGSARPCWRRGDGAYKLLDPRGGLSSVLLTRRGATRRILVQGGGAALDAPYLPLDVTGGVVVQLHETDRGRCWGAAFARTDVERNDGGHVGRRSRSDGYLVATMP